ncbi:nucleoside hydrolase [Acerihabitans arboris]|uniref:Nucleoside hydrolase n=1 Tax=Acerihabitans arboris TaxID=2691583 RepID=A0A845SEC7_9GAMM|nr:nucleoside hydrolase [Acerihabitans arboris]NDL61762.1 nucleoside hydrolase [Acerihabitans arboris]
MLINSLFLARNGRLIALLWLLVAPGLQADAAAAGKALPFTPDADKQIRVMISSDAKNEADDDFAIAHALLTPTFDVRGLIAAQYARTAPMMKRQDEQTMEESYQELKRLTAVMDHSRTPVYRGAALNSLPARPAAISEGARAIVSEGMRDDKRPLFILVLGPATDIAAALRAEPEIADRLTVIWIGGMPYPRGGWEYNLYNDPHAANVLMSSSVPVWQVPHNVYMSMRVSLAELAVRVKPQGAVGSYLWRQMIEFNQRASKLIAGVPWPKSEVWILGDNPAISLLLDDEEYHYQMVNAPHINDDLTYGPQAHARQIRVYNAIDARFTLEDFYAKLALAFGKEN